MIYDKISDYLESNTVRCVQDLMYCTCTVSDVQPVRNFLISSSHITVSYNTTNAYSPSHQFDCPFRINSNSF